MLSRQPILCAIAGKTRHFWRVSRTTADWLFSTRHWWAIYLPDWMRRCVRGNSSREIVMLSVSEMRIDPRIEREARALVGAGYMVKIIYPDASPPFFHEVPIDWGPGITFRPIAASAGQYAFNFPWLFGVQLHSAALEEKPLAYHSHDLPTALIGLSAAAKRNAYCVCDFHEWWSENVSWNYELNSWAPHPLEKKLLFRFAERLAMKRSDAVVTVCDSIAEELTQNFSRRKLPVTVVRNIPSLLQNSTTAYAPLRDTLDLPANQFILLWQGGTGPSRFIEPIIEALKYAPDVTFVIRGPSLEYYGDDYQKLAAKVGVLERLALLPPVPSGDVVRAAISADAGIWTLPKLSKNFYYALPNKIFEYLAAGLPVLAADYPEARKIILPNGIGLCFDPYDPQSIAEQLNRMVHDRALLVRMREAIPGVLVKIDANREWGKIVSIYDTF